MGDGLNVNAAEGKHVAWSVLHDKDVVTSRAVESGRFKGGDGRRFYSKARLAGGAHHNDVRRWGVKSRGLGGTRSLSRTLPVAFCTNRVHIRHLWKHAQ